MLQHAMKYGAWVSTCVTCKRLRTDHSHAGRNVSGLLAPSQAARIRSDSRITLDAMIDTAPGYAYCLDMHSKDARADGESEQRLYVLSAWRETPFFTDRERAALAWTEAVTQVGQDHVPDSEYDNVRQCFGEEELVNLTLAIATINAWKLSIHDLSAGSSRFPSAEDRVEPGCRSNVASFPSLVFLASTQLLNCSVPRRSVERSEMTKHGKTFHSVS